MSIRKQTAMWTTKDGSKTRICDMSDQHLINTIRFLERSVDAIKLKMAVEYPCFNGEMAQYYAEREFYSAINADVEHFYPIYEKLMMEAERRGINADH